MSKHLTQSTGPVGTKVIISEEGIKSSNDRTKRGEGKKGIITKWISDIGAEVRWEDGQEGRYYWRELAKDSLSDTIILIESALDQLALQLQAKNS
jgi:hypothetical protein